MQEVLSSRRWPRDVAEYADMMSRTTEDRPENAAENLTFDPKFGVDFTDRGDRGAVEYNFFKMTFDVSCLA